MATVIINKNSSLNILYFYWQKFKMLCFKNTVILRQFYDDVT